MNNFFLNSKNVILLSFLVTAFLSSHFANAQSYKWVKGGGSSTNMAPLGGSNSEAVRNMCTDDNSNIYIITYVGINNILADTFYAAAAHYSSNVHAFIASYTCSGTMRWAKLFEGINYSDIVGLEYYKGSIYVTGWQSSDMFHPKYFGYDTVVINNNYASYIARFDTGNNGDMKWIRFIGDDVYGNHSLTKAGKIAVDGQGFIHNFAPIKRGCVITPTFTTTQAGTYDLKYDTTGNLLSVSQITILDSVWTISSLAYNKLSGTWFATIGPSDFWYSVIGPVFNSAVCAFRPDNTLIWKDTTGDGGFVSALAYKGGSDLYICGDGAGSAPSYNIGGITVSSTMGAYSTVFKLDTNDNGKWAYTVMTSLSVCNFNGLTILPDNKIAVAGLFVDTARHGTDMLVSPSVEGQNPLFITIDTGGHTIKFDQLHGTGFYDYGTAITSDKIGNVYIGGQVESNIWGGSLTPYISNGGNTDYFVMKYGYDCSCLTAPPPVASYTHTVTTSTFSAAFTYTGSIGYDSVRWQFGDGSTSTLAVPTHTYAGSGTYTACVTVYTSCGSNTYCNTINFSLGIQQPAAGNIHIYPNPTHDELIVTGISNTTTYRLMNITGAVVRQSTLQNNNTISLKDCAPGMYIVEIVESKGMRSVVRVVKE